MKRKVDTQDLQIGMYVSALDRPWVDTPFLFQGFQLRDDEDIKSIQQYCRYVEIDTDEGSDLDPSKADRRALDRARILEVETQKTNAQFKSLTERPDISVTMQRQAYHDSTPIEKEIVTARKIEHRARALTKSTYENVRKGKDPDLNEVSAAVDELTDSIIRNPDALMCLSQLKNASEYAALHSVRSCIVALAFGRHLVFSQEELKTLGLGALMKDVGMAQIPDTIINKPGQLTPEEQKIMKTHVPRGAAMLERAGFPPGAIEMAAQHHARYDGSGYPRDIYKEKIGTYGGIAAIVDVYDAMSSETGYRQNVSAEDVLRKMYEWRDKDFHGKLVEEFIQAMGIYPIGSLVELSTGAIGVVISINRARRLKPKVALVLNSNKVKLQKSVVTDLSTDKDEKGDEMKIKTVLPAGSFEINPMDYIVQL